MKKFLAMALLTGSLFFSGCGSSENFVFTNTGNGPVCQADAYTTNEDTALTVDAASGVLANDTPNGGTATFAPTSSGGGTITGSADGSFTYTPLNGFTGDDTFGYTVSNSVGQSTCTVTVAVVAVNGFFVDAVNGNDGTGSFQGGLPFLSIQAAVAAAPVGADIVVLPGNYTGAVTLKNGQRLLGSSSLLVNAQSTTQPVLTGPVVLADGNTLDFLRIAGTAGNAVDADGQNGGTVTNCEFANTTAGGNGGSGVRGNDTRGTWTVSNNRFENLAGGGVGFQTIGSNSATYIVRNNTMTGNGLLAVGFSSEGTSDVKAQVQGNTFTGNNTVTGDAFELACSDNSSFGLNLEDNTNDKDSNPNNGEDGVYRVGEFNSANLKIEQFGKLTDSKPEGAGNTGFVDDSSTGIIEDVPRGTFTF